MASVISAGTTSNTSLNLSGDTSGVLQLASNGSTTAVTIDTSQNVGIGTASPAKKLTVNTAGTAGAMIRLTDGTQQSFDIESDVGAGGAGVISYNTVNGGQQAFKIAGTERMRINAGGYVKASNDGTYVSTAGTYHEFRNTASDPALFLTATNASFGSNAQIIDVTRAATSGYNFALLRSGASGSQDNEFILRGDGNGYADGTWNNNGADYAEYFESATGQVIPTGSTVVLENNKVRLATESDNPADIIGVVRPKEPSKASMVVGNTAWNKWADKYLTDDFDRYIMEDHNTIEWADADGKQHSYESHNIPENVVVPQDAIVKTHDDKGNKFEHYKLNPAWNPDAEYVNRENRDEWLIIGLIGQVKVLKGQVMGDRWKKMRDVSASVEEWFIR